MAAGMASPPTCGLAAAIAGLLLCGAARADPETVAAAERAANEGLARYDRHEYDGAAEAFRRAWTLDPQPAVLFALAQAERKAGRCDLADADYRRFIALGPPAAQRRAAQNSIGRCTPAPPIAPPPIAPPPIAPPIAPPVVDPPGPTVVTAPARPTSRRWVALPAAFAGITLASAVAGAALYGVAHAEYGTLSRSACGVAGDCADAAYAGTRTKAYASYGLFAAAGALAIVDVVLWVTAARRR